jgi:hypothetical protein
MISTDRDAQSTCAEPADSKFASACKAIKDLDLLVRALLTSLPAAKPWQRQLRAHLGEADRLMQVLRLTIAMDRGAQEIARAAEDLLAALRAANAYAGAGRTDQGTKTAVQLGFGLANKVYALVGEARAR